MKNSRVQQALLILNASAQEFSIEGLSIKQRKGPKPGPKKPKKVTRKPQNAR
jgi:hypothetical protein